MYIADFETTVDNDTNTQESTEVWAFGVSRLFDDSDYVEIGNCIEDFFDYLCTGARREKKIIYFCNLKFDGSFIISYLTRDCGFRAGYDEQECKFAKEKDLKEGEFTTVITDLGIWYNIVCNYKGYILEFRDTLKLLNFSVHDLHFAFDTKHEKLDMEYKGNMCKGGIITPEQMEYITNDILVPKEALEKFFNEIGVSKNPPLTLGQSALSQFKKRFSKDEWNLYFPNLAEIKLDKGKYGAPNVDSYVRKSYLGGWCCVDETKTGIIQGHTKTADVNSLYPSVMRDHNNPMPIGAPIMTKNPTEITRQPKDAYYFIRFRCRFDLKPGYLPFIQLKHDFNYRGNENLKTSKYDRFGHILKDYTPEITLSKTMFILFSQCYYVKDFHFLDMCIFPNTEIGLFDSYIDHYMKLKEQAVQEHNKVRKTIAKLYMNVIYGKFARNPENSFKVPVLNDENEIVDYIYDSGEDHTPIYIPIASAITSYARRFTVKASIMNKDVWIYSDTDSCHFVCDPDYVPKGMEIHESKLNCWKIENESENSLFIRQKTYIEYTEDKENPDFSIYDIKACGMPERCKMLFEQNLKHNYPDGDLLHIPVYEDDKIVDYKTVKLSDDEIKFMETKRKIQDFHNGFSVPGKLIPKIIKGGTVLTEVDFTIN